MTSRRHRPRAVLAVLTLVIAACMAVIAAGPASATPTPTPKPPGRTLIPMKVSPKPAFKPNVAQAVVSDTCGTVRANLKRYAARHVSRVSCTTATRGTATTATAKASARAGARVTPMAASWCGSESNVWIFDRTEECLQGGGVTVTIWDPNTGAVTGTAHFTINQDILLSPTNGIFTENDTVYWDAGTGDGALPGTVYYDLGCGSPCTTLYGGSFVAAMSLGDVDTVAFAGEDTPGTTTPDTFTTAYAFELSVPVAVTVGTATWTSPETIRCDNQLGGQPPGCVFRDATVLLELSLATYGAGAANVYFAENLIPGAPGLSTPLTRGDPSLTRSNRDAICDSTFIYSTLVPDDSCDEYPFASSQQSGGANNLVGSDCMELMPVNLNGTWYYENFNTVSGQACERGHVPAEENEDVGTPLITMINTNRVLVGDPYYVVVTA